MQRTYSPRHGSPQPRRRLGRHLDLGLAAAGAIALSLPAGSSATNLFNSRPLDGSRFAVLAKPVAASEWTLLVLEQIKPEPRCWQQRPDGLIDPALNRFDFTGICSRYLDSNGYSLRIGDEDLASRYRLRLEQRGSNLALLAMSPNASGQLLVGRGLVPQRDRDGFVQIQLEPGWQLQRRVYGQQTLSHIYFANNTPLAQLLGPGGNVARAASPQPLQPSIRMIPSPLQPQGPIALQVIPFRP